MHTKAWLRAVRDRIGLSQAALAKLANVTVDTVKKWENPRYNPVPDDVVTIVQALLDKHEAVVADAVAASKQLRSEHDGALPEAVELTYYRSQAEYDRYGRDSLEGLPDTYQVVNARTREIAVEMEHRGIPVEYVYPEQRGPSL